MGLVSEIFTDDVLAKLPGPMAIGHTRYSTTGDSALLNAQPIRVDSTKGLIAIAHNGNLVNLGNLRARLERDGAYFQTTSDSEIIVQLIAHSQRRHARRRHRRLALAGRRRILHRHDDARPHLRRPRSARLPPALHGPHENMPTAPTPSSSPASPAPSICSAPSIIRDVLPGELVMVSEDGVTSRQYATGVPQSSCIFEHVYFARPDSRIFGRWVQESRDQMGRQLARESGVPADVVVPVPDSGVTAALGYAEEAGLPFRFGLIRNHYVGRTFIEPEQRVRDFGVRLKLNPVHNLLEGKRVILIDDSIIRGTTSRKIVRMVRGAGATEVHLRISCPPTISPCFYGVDTPSKRDLIAANQLRRRDSPIHRGRLARLSVSRWPAAVRPGPEKSRATAPPATPATTPRSGSTSKTSFRPPRVSRILCTNSRLEEARLLACPELVEGRRETRINGGALQAAAESRFRRARVHPRRKPNRINPAFRPLRMFLRRFALCSKFFRSLFSAWERFL